MKRPRGVFWKNPEYGQLLLFLAYREGVYKYITLTRKEILPYIGENNWSTTLKHVLIKKKLIKFNSALGSNRSFLFNILEFESQVKEEFQNYFLEKLNVLERSIFKMESSKRVSLWKQIQPQIKFADISEQVKEESKQKDSKKVTDADELYKNQLMHHYNISNEEYDYVVNKDSKLMIKLFDLDLKLENNKLSNETHTEKTNNLVKKFGYDSKDNNIRLINKELDSKIPDILLLLIIRNFRELIAIKNKSSKISLLKIIWEKNFLDSFKQLKALAEFSIYDVFDRIFFNMSANFENEIEELKALKNNTHKNTSIEFDFSGVRELYVFSLIYSFLFEYKTPKYEPIKKEKKASKRKKTLSSSKKASGGS